MGILMKTPAVYIQENMNSSLESTYRFRRAESDAISGGISPARSLLTKYLHVKKGWFQHWDSQVN